MGDGTRQRGGGGEGPPIGRGEGKPRDGGKGAEAAGAGAAGAAGSSAGGGMLFLAGLAVGLALAMVVAAAVVGTKSSPSLQRALLDVLPEAAVKAAAKGGLQLDTHGFDAELEVSGFGEGELPPTPVHFSVHFNGDGTGAGEQADSSQFRGLNDMIRRSCSKMGEIRKMAKDNARDAARLCDPEQGAKLYNARGRRLRSLRDVSEGGRTYVVPQGVFFVWPLVKVGDVVEPEAVHSPVEGKPIRLRQLSMSPRVFTVENFMSAEEMTAILDHNRDLVKPSEVGFAGWRDSTRTSWTAWDFHSWAARKVQRRSFDLLGIDYDSELADATQVLRYNLSEWYKPHTDWFDEKAYDGHDPVVNNGTNRFATVFLYLTDVEDGGHTVFPLSSTHEGYNGEQLVHPGTNKTPGYIAQRDAEWVCNTSSTALRSMPKAGNAVLFYSQGPDGALDTYSLHGGCPVVKGLKWSANVWIWNRPKPDKKKAKDGKPDTKDESISMMFNNKLDESVDLFWDDGSDEGVFQMTIEAGLYSPMTTYHGHRFKARKHSGGPFIFDFTANDKYKGKEHVAAIGGDPAASQVQEEVAAASQVQEEEEEEEDEAPAPANKDQPKDWRMAP
jgi:prolyl 4-hydroxylase